MLKNLFKPRWLALTFTLLLIIYLFIRLSDWQFDRYDQRIKNNGQIMTALASTPVSINGSNDLNNLDVWQKITVSGQYIDSQSKLIRKQYLESSLGFYVITPFEVSNEYRILVNRGWIPIGDSANSVQVIPPAPSGKVEITGYVRNFETPRKNPEDLPANQINYLDPSLFLEINDSQNYVQLGLSNPKDLNVAKIPLPELSNGPHLSYAIQWILFALLLPIGWYILLRSEKIFN